MPAIEIIITVAAAFCLISAFITCGIGFYVYAQKTSSTVHRIFFASMLSAAYWATGEFFIWQADSLEGVTFWLKFSSVWTLTLALAIHFILAFTKKIPEEKKLRTILMVCIYTPSIILCITELFTECLFSAAYDPVFGYIYQPAMDNPICIIQILYITSVFFISMYIGFISWREAAPGKIRSQNRLLFAGILATTGSAAISVVFLPLLGIHIPNLVFIGYVICSVMIVIAVQRYGLFVLSPETAVPEIMKTMPDGLILVDKKGEIIAANESAEEIFSSTEQSLTGKSAGTLIPEDDYSLIFGQIEDKKKIADYELSIAEEIPKYVSISGSAVCDSSGETSGTVLILRDITGRKTSERSLQAANNKLSMLSQLTRHDIGNLVTALSGNLCIMESESREPETDQYLRQSLEIVDMIIKQLEFSRNYQQIGAEKPRWNRLNYLIKRAENSVIHEGIEIKSLIEPVMIYADPLLEKVLYNLLENAVRHGEKITEITISTEKQNDGSLIIRFSDNGTGIPDEEKEKIFSYGYGKNTGFGLAFSRELLSVTGIEIAERGVYKKGASFEIKVPAGAWKKETGHFQPEL